jgi:thiol:disulfide interchange protein
MVSLGAVEAPRPCTLGLRLSPNVLMNRLTKLRPAWASAIACTLLLTGLIAGCEIGTEMPPGETSQVGTGPRVSRGKLNFVEGYQQGHSAALAQSKPMLVFFTAEWCHFCHQMADEAFTHPQVARLADQFVCILVDADQEPQICRQFDVTGYPTIQFLSARGVPLERMVGKKPGHQVMMAMQAALQNIARRNVAGRGIVVR